MSSEPVHCCDDYKWYFWDEIWEFQHGPYNTEQLAREACIEYARRLNKEKIQ